MGCRSYAPCVGRFLSRDPGGFGAGANLYAFCMADPVNFFDANGCFPLSNEGLWNGIQSAADAESSVPFLLGIPTALMGAHDAFGNWGNAAGNPKISAADTWKAGGMAGLHFANATVACAGPVLGAMRGLGALSKAEEAVAATESIESEEQVLIRVNKRARGGGPANQSADTLQRQSLEAADNPAYGVHGVSVREPESLSRPVLPHYGQATAEQIEQHFPLIKTGEPGHYTVGLPNPVTEEAAEIFNKLFGFPTK